MRGVLPRRKSKAGEFFIGKGTAFTGMELARSKKGLCFRRGICLDRNIIFWLTASCPCWFRWRLILLVFVFCSGRTFLKTPVKSRQVLFKWSIPCYLDSPVSRSRCKNGPVLRSSSLGVCQSMRRPLCRLEGFSCILWKYTSKPTGKNFTRLCTMLECFIEPWCMRTCRRFIKISYQYQKSLFDAFRGVSTIAV